MSRLTHRPNGLAGVGRVLATRYAYDDLGRIIDTGRSTRDGFSPRFVLGRAGEGVIWRFRNDLETEVMRGIARLAAREMGFPIADAERPTRPERLHPIERLLSEAADGPVEVRHEWVEDAGERLGELWLLG